MTLSNIEATAWRDETQKVCDIGGNGNQYFVLWLPRDSNGRINLKNCQYNKNLNMYKVKVKYNKTVWMSLGCAITHKKDSDGEATIEEGNMCMHFNYSERVILSVTDYKENIKKEIALVKALKNGTLGIRISISTNITNFLCLVPP